MITVNSNYPASKESHRLAYSVPEVAEMLGLGTTSIYELLREQKLIGVKNGRRTLIRKSDLENYLENLPKYCS